VPKLAAVAADCQLNSALFLDQVTAPGTAVYGCEPYYLN
jgi:hypothetical protein